MTYRIAFRRAAAAEYANAARWYEDRAAGVGHRFIKRIEQALALISALRQPVAPPERSTRDIGFPAEIRQLRGTGLIL
jgi:hypothetical protein